MDDEILLSYLLQDKKVGEKSKDFLRLNMNEVYSRILYSKGIAVPEDMKHEINELIIKQKNIFRELIMKIEDQEIEKWGYPKEHYQQGQLLICAPVL